MRIKTEYIQRSIRIPKNLYEKAKEEAKKDSRSFNNFVALALKEYMQSKNSCEETSFVCEK